MMGLAAALIVVISARHDPGASRRTSGARPLAVMMGATFVGGMPVGPVGGRVDLEHSGGGVFLMNVPVALVALVLVLVLVPEPERTAPREPVDLIGLVLGWVASPMVTYGLIEAGSAGWNSPRCAGWIVGGLIVLVLMIGWKPTWQRPGRPCLSRPCCSAFRDSVREH